MSTGIRIEAAGFEAAARALRDLADVDVGPLLDALGSTGESQTRRRLSDEKRAPDGAAWDAWSDGYAATRHAGQSLLESQGGLVDSQQYLVDGAAVEWGSNLVYAAIHQHGGLPGMAPGPAAVPARPYLGLSTENLADLDAIALEWAEGLLI